jgi:hypothetical protein
MLQQQHETPSSQSVEIAIPTTDLSTTQAASESVSQQMTPEEIDALLATINAEAARRKRYHTIQKGVFITLFGLAMLGLLIFLIHGLVTGHWGKGEWLNFFSFTGVFGGMAAASKPHKEAASKLAQTDDLRAVGPLVDSWDIEDKHVREVVEPALIRLLPQMKASDAGLLNAEQRDRLNRILKYKHIRRNRWTRHAALVVAILRAYQQVGDSKALQAVQRLADGEGFGAREQGIREAAEACLPFLRLRAEQELAAGTLLRAAAASDTPSNVLLRPAQGVGSTPPQQLLRPSEPSENRA